MLGVRGKHEGRKAGKMEGRMAGRQGYKGVQARQGGREAGRQGGREAGRQGGREAGRYSAGKRTVECTAGKGKGLASIQPDSALPITASLLCLLNGMIITYLKEAGPLHFYFGLESWCSQRSPDMMRGAEFGHRSRRISAKRLRTLFHLALRSPALFSGSLSIHSPSSGSSSSSCWLRPTPGRISPLSASSTVGCKVERHPDIFPTH